MEAEDLIEGVGHHTVWVKGGLKVRKVACEGEVVVEVVVDVEGEEVFVDVVDELLAVDNVVVEVVVGSDVVVLILVPELKIEDFCDFKIIINKGGKFSQGMIQRWMNFHLTSEFQITLKYCIIRSDLIGQLESS